MAHCSDHLPGVALMQFEEFEDWHKCPRAFDDYEIKFILPPRLQIIYQPDDKLFACAFLGDVNTLQQFSDKEICEYRDQNGNNLVTIASFCDQLKVIQFLHAKGALVNHSSHTGVTPILAAASNNYLLVAEWLINNGADVNKSNEQGISPLSVSAYHGHKEMVARLIQAGSDVNWEDVDGKTSLMAACQRGHASVVRELVADRERVNILQASQGPPAPFFVAVSGESGCLLPLVECNKEVLHITDHQGWSLLSVAAFHGNLRLVKEMIKLGVNVDAKDKYGRTALMAAAEVGHADIVEFLLEKKASVIIQANSGASAFHLALSKGFREITRALVEHVTCGFDTRTRSSTLLIACRAGDVDVAKHLVKVAGSFINKQNHLGVSPLIASCMSRTASLTAYLLTVGADVNVKTENKLNAYQVAYLRKDYKTLELLEPHFASEIGTLCCDIPVAAACLGDVEVMKNLIQRGEDITTANSKGITALMVASYKGDGEMAKLLLEYNADVAVQNQSGATAIMYAIDANNHSMVDFLIGHGASVNTKYPHGTTLCHYLTRLEKIDLLAKVVHFGGDINCQDKDGMTPLMIACKQGLFDLVKYLVAVNASLTKRCTDDLNAIEHALINDKIDICSYLKELSDNNPEQQRISLFMRRFDASDEDSPFFKACCAGELSLVQECHRAGQNVNTLNHGETSALHYASYHGHEDIVQWLLEHGALINSTAKDGITALMIACDTGHEDVVQVLIKHKCLINMHDDIYRNALTFTVAQQRTSILRMLLQQKPVVDIVNGEGDTPLNLACLKGYIDIVMILVENHADVNKRDAFGRTPLMAAARKGFVEVAQFLMENGADVGVVSDEGKTAAGYARDSNHTETYNLIQHTAIEQDITLLDIEDVQVAAITTESKQEIFFDLCENGLDINQLTELVNRDGVNLNDTNMNGETGLFLAVTGGHHEVIDLLLSKHVDINTSNKRGDTALLYAVQTGWVDMVTKLVEKGADLEVKDQFGNDLITIATDAENKQLLKYLVCQNDKKVGNDETWYNQLLEDIEEGDIMRVAEALENVEIPIDRIHTIMSYAFLCFDGDVLNKLISVCSRLLDNLTPALMLCIESSKCDTLSACLSGVDMSTLDLVTLLSTASRHGEMSALKALLSGNNHISGAHLKTVLLQTLEWARYEVVPLLVQSYTRGGGQLDIQGDCDQPLMPGDFLVSLRDRDMEVVLI